MSPPAPYIPPPLAGPAHVGGPADDPHRPWLALRDGETPDQWHTRISRTCYFCGVYIVESRALDEHENQHYAR